MGFVEHRRPKKVHKTLIVKQTVNAVDNQILILAAKTPPLATPTHIIIHFFLYKYPHNLTLNTTLL